MKSKLPNVGATIFTKMTKLAQEYSAINLSQGFPSFEPPSPLLKYIQEALDSEENQYAPMQGMPHLVNFLAKRHQKKGASWIEPSNITVTAGATEGLFTAILSLVHPGDEVIVFDPAYDSYKPAIQMAGGKVIPITLEAPKFKPNWEILASKIHAGTRMIIINTPHNPTGTLWSETDWEKLENHIADKNIIVLSDEVYENITFDEHVHMSALQRPALQDRVLATYSFGKTFHATGWKSGYIMGSKTLIDEFNKVHQYNVFCVHRPTQVGIHKFWKEYPYFIKNMRTTYESRRDLFESEMAKTKFKAIPTSGTYFQLYDYSNISELNDVDFCKEITKKYGVAAIPISVFYNHPPQNQKLIRLCFAKDKEQLSEAAQRLARINSI